MLSSSLSGNEKETRNALLVSARFVWQEKQIYWDICKCVQVLSCADYCVFEEQGCNGLMPVLY